MSQTEFSWLLEIRGHLGVYFSPGYRAGDKWEWVTTDSNEAVRFARQEDANRVISAIRSINSTFFQGLEWMAVQHGWIEK